jgi:beta-N-acetylglucosaminidase
MKLNKNKLVLSILSLLIITSSSFTTYIYLETKKDLEYYQEKNKELSKKLKEKEKFLSEKIDEVKNYEDSVSKLEEFISELESKNKELESKNKELEERIKELLSIPEMNPSNVTSKSNVTETGLKMALKNTGLQGLEPSFVQAEKEYGINAIFLTSLVALESEWGNSSRAKRHNNLSGYAVYNDIAVGRIFSSKHESIMETARLIKEDYVGQGRFDIYSIGKKYSADINWAVKVASISNEIKANANLNKYILN